MHQLTRTILISFHRTFKNFSLAGAIAGVLAMVLVYLLAGEIYNYRDTVDLQRLPAVDAIVCLGGGKGRLAAAGDLWYRYWQQSQLPDSLVKSAPVLYLSGMGPQTNWAILSRQLRPAVLQKIRPDSVVIEKESSNTDRNARWLAKYAQQQHWKKVLLLTSSYHMRRAKFIFSKVLTRGSDPVGLETLSFAQEPFTPTEWRSGPNAIRVTLMEYLKWIYYNSFWRPTTGVL